MGRCKQPRVCHQTGGLALPCCRPRLIWKRFPSSLLRVALLSPVLILTWMRRTLAPICEAAAAASAQQASTDCAIYIYADPQQEPTKLIDQTSCPTGGGSRAFFVDKGSRTRTFPNLLEAAPFSDHAFLCKSKRPCNVVVTGYGLEQKDRLMLVRMQDSSSPPSCPPEEPEDGEQQRPQQQVQATRHIRTSSKMAYDHSVRPQSEQTIMAVFDLGHPQEGSYAICYSTNRSTSKGAPQLKDFHYRAGALSVESEPRYVCDFEKDICDFMVYRDHMDLDLYFRRDAGATETPGTGPSFDHTLGPRQRGHYIYMDSPGYVAGASATLLGRPAIYPPGLYCVRFFYHMWGDDVNSLRMYMHALKHDEDITGDWGKPQLLRVGDHGDQWIQGGFEFRSDGHTAQQLVIEALAGFSEKGDIALDDISLSAGRCEENIKRDSYQGDYICGEVRLASGDWSEEKSWYVEGAVSCAGRGYSYDALRGSWMPCCVSRYGDYTLVLHDGYGDGWSGSKLEFRFFDETQTFGEDFIGGEDGVERKYTLNVGLVQLTRVEGSSDSIRLEVQVAQPQSYVWCGAALAESPAPTVEILKKYGIRSHNPTTVPGEKMLLEIKNKPKSARVLQAHTDYNVYCYAEPSAEAASQAASTPADGEFQQHQAPQEDIVHQQSSSKKMDDKQVEASRTPVTTDNTPPVITLEDLEVGTTSATLHLSADEACTVYCLTVETGAADAMAEAPSVTAFKSQKSSKISILKGAEGVPQHLQLQNMSPDTFYKLFCYAEDRALPRPNVSSPEDIQATAVDLQTPSKVPDLSVSSYEAFVRGFRLQVMSDTPARIWCAAAMSGSAFPKKEDVKRVGATSELWDITKPAQLEIRGVPPNTRYSIYCLGSSRSGSAETSEEQMWANALEVASFGKFCEIPLDPPVLSEGGPTPFDPLTPAEEQLVRDFLRIQHQLKLEGVYRVNLYADKKAILAHYEKGAAVPSRYARVRAGTCDRGKGAFRQLKVGPLPDPQDAESDAATGARERAHRGRQQLQLEDIGSPIETDCGGYNPQGVFGRRLLAEEGEDNLDAFLLDAFGLHFGRKKCKYEEEDKICAVHGPFVFKEENNGDLQEIWIGLKASMSSERANRLQFDHRKHRYEKSRLPTGELPAQKGDQAQGQDVLKQEEALRRQQHQPRQEETTKQKQQQARGQFQSDNTQRSPRHTEYEHRQNYSKVAGSQIQEVVYLPFYFVTAPHASLRNFDSISSIFLPEHPEFVAQLLTRVKGYWVNGRFFESLGQLREAFNSKQYPELSPAELRKALNRPSLASSNSHLLPEAQQRSQPRNEQKYQQEQVDEYQGLQQGLLPQENGQQQEPHRDESGLLTFSFPPRNSLPSSSAGPHTSMPFVPPPSDNKDVARVSRRLGSGNWRKRLLNTARRSFGVRAPQPATVRDLQSHGGPPLTDTYTPVLHASAAPTSPASAFSMHPPRDLTATLGPPTTSSSTPLPSRRLSVPSAGDASGVNRIWPGPNPRGRGGLEYRAGPEHIEPQGKRYTIKHNPSSTSYTIEYLGWSMTVTNDRDTSLRIWNLRFNGERYAFELGVNEALAHYSVAERHWYFMDSWYGGLGAAARRVHAGIECTKTATILFFDQSLCVFEQDKARPLRSHWKGGILRDAAPHYVLVLRQIITVSNYDYITDYTFHGNGFFEASMAFTGELYAGVEVPWFSARQAAHGTQVTGSMRMGALHAHLASWKVDFDLDNYEENSILWHEVKKDSSRPGALRLDSWIAETEEQAYFKFNDTRPLHYQVVHEDHKVYGNVGGFTVLPLPTVAIPNPDFELFSGPAAWAKYRILTTLRKEEEYHGSLPRDNKYALRPAVSLDRFIQDNDSIRRRDVVTWVSSAVWHIPVIEDMPQTLSLGNTLGFMVKPHNYFTEDVSMDLHNALGGAIQDPGTCAIIRQELEKYLAE